MTAADVINAVSSDVRNQLSASGDASLMLGWVDRIHKDCLRSSNYASLARDVVTLSTVAGTSSYALPVGAVREILWVYDRSKNRLIEPIDMLGQPMPRGELRQQTASSSSPEGYWLKNSLTSAPTLYFFPAPQQMASVDVYYSTRIPTLASTATTLTLPDDALDTMVAGVNFMAHGYLKASTDSQYWFAIYEKLKAGK